MTEEDLRIVRELLDRAKENFERDGYLTPASLACGPGWPAVMSPINGNVDAILPRMYDALRTSGHDRFGVMTEGGIAERRLRRQERNRPGHKDPV